MTRKSAKAKKKPAPRLRRKPAPKAKVTPKSAPPKSPVRKAAPKPAPKSAPKSTKPPAPPQAPPVSDAYDRFREQQAQISRARSQSGREIGPLPPVKDPDRRAACLDDDELFLLTYLKPRFPLPFCSAHREVIDRGGQCIRDGGLFAVAFMRGGGKTTIAEGLTIKAIVYGLRRFVVLTQATQPLAKRSLRKIKHEFEFNDLLAEDFPEACYPIRRLERNAVRAKMQTLGGKPTLMQWAGDGITLAMIDGSPCSGATIYVTGITGALKGLSANGPNGEIIRPDLVIIDDAQTRESARSATQTTDREAIISDDILALAGPTTTIAAMMLCTPIYVDDLSERFLDRDKHPEWVGVRTQMLPSFPERMDLWDQYAELRRTSLRDGGDGRHATEFYLANAEAMSAGAVVTWPERLKAGPFEGVDGLELAMILFYHSPTGMQAEYNCKPEEAPLGAGEKRLSAEAVAERLSGCDRLLVPQECSRLTVFFDPGLTLLWYAVVAWNESFGGSVIDYGCYPQQGRSFFEAADARPSLKNLHPGYTDAQVVYAALEALVPTVLSRTYSRQGGGEMRVNQCLIDSGWESKAVYQWVRQSNFATIIHPSKGIGRTLTSRGVSEWRPRPGEQKGYHWRLTMGEEGRIRAVQFDPDAWKSFLFGALTTLPGGAKGLTLWGKTAGKHDLISAHCAAESGLPATVRGTTFDKWLPVAGANDNHLLDCLTGAACAASVAGLTWSASEQPVRDEPKKPPVKWSEVWHAKHGKSASAV